MLCFTKTNGKSITSIKQIIRDFSEFTGLQVNRERSLLTFSVEAVDRDELLGILDFQEGSLPITYLGVLILVWEARLADC